LAREETIIGIQPELVAPFHGARQNGTAKLAAVIAGTARSKKIQRGRPFPISIVPARPKPASRVSMNAIESSCQVFLSHPKGGCPICYSASGKPFSLALSGLLVMPNCPKLAAGSETGQS
jgi:hypothetical protein